MKRANLLLTDRSSSGSKMTTTGHSTPSGSTRTKATKGLFSHFMFLASLLLITLLTSGKALAQDTYTVEIVGSNLTVEPDVPIAIGTKTFKLVPAAGYKLPATITVVYDAADANTTLDHNTDLESANQYKYDLTEGADYGTVTISILTDIAAGKVITITADGVELGHVATLEALTYSNDNISSGAPQNVPDFDNSEIPEISLAYDKNLESSAIRMAGTPTSGSNATITSNDGATITDGAAQATVIVTSEDGEVTKDYVVNFKVANDKLSSITVPTITLESRVSSAAEALELLNAAPNNSFDVVTEGQQDDITLLVEWTFTESFNATAEAQNNFTWTIDESELTEKKLDQNEVALTGTVAVTNAAASTDVKLKTLTYSINGASGETVTNFNTSDNEATQNYSVTLLADVPKDAEITVVAEANDENAVIAGELTGSLSSNTVTITFTVTAEDEGTSRTVNVIFTRTPSAVATLASLKYKIGANGDEKDVPGFIEGGTAYSDISVPYNTTEAITILPVATDEKNGATIEGNTTVTLSGGKASTTLTVRAEDGSATQQVAISFLADKEKITAIAAPTAPVLTSLEENTAEKVLEKVNAIKTVSATLEGGTTVELPVEWAIKEQFNATHGVKNTYTWTITAGSYEEYDINEQPTTGEMIVTNYIAAVTEDQGAITINAGDPYTQIGSSESKNITVESVIVDASVDKLAFDNVTVSGAVAVNQPVPTITLTDTEVGGKIDLKADVPSIVLSNASVDEIALASSMTTALTVQSGSRIETITNAGTLTLKDAADVAPLSLAIDTRAALTNGSLVGVVNNSGTFTDETATIVIVGGDASLSITSQPKNQSTYGTEVALTVATAEPANGESITYQWQKNIGGVWESATGTGHDGATLTVGKTGDGAGSFRCKVVSSKSPATTTLYTRTATVTFLTESGPSEPSTPSTPTYTVSLDKVAGATFSKGETTTVDEGDNFSFKITLDKDYDQSKPVVTVDGTAITADADGNYTIKNIQKDIKIIVSGIVKNTATGIEENVADAARAWSVGSTLYIHVPEASDVYVVSGTGALQQQLRGVSGDYNMQLRAGFYIVRIGEVSQKVIIR